MTDSVDNFSSICSSNISFEYVPLVSSDTGPSRQELMEENKKLKKQLEIVNTLFNELRFYPLDHGDYEMMERIYEYEKEYGV